jgi:DivIVA domain-containing protein
MVNEQADAPTSGQTGGQMITPADIQRQEFGVSRFGGYRMRDVDEFLDRLTESTEILVAENDRLRAGGPPIVGTSDLDEVNRHADEIVQRARDEAARILADARTHSAPTNGAPSVAVPDEAQRARVDAFLSQERAFLQSLATLVQGHAESVKGMAREARRAASAQPTPSPDEEPGEDAPGGRTEADISLPEAGEDHDDEPTPAESTPGADATVILEEPQPTRMGAERAREADPSLRQLFWGEER